MARIDFIKMSEATLQRAGELWRAKEDLDWRKKQFKQKEKELETEREANLTIAKSKAMEDAQSIYKLLNPEKGVTRHVQHVVYGEPGTETTGERRVKTQADITYGGLTAGGQSSSSLRADLRGIEDDMRAITTSYEGAIAALEPQAQELSNIIADIETLLLSPGPETRQKIYDLHNIGQSKLKALSGDVSKQVYIEPAAQQLASYTGLAIRKLDNLLAVQAKPAAAAPVTQPGTQPTPTTPPVTQPTPTGQLTPEQVKQVQDIWNNERMAEDQKWDVLAAWASEWGVDYKLILDAVTE